MAITIQYGDYTFAGTGSNLLLLSPVSAPDMFEVWDPIGEALAWDTLTFGVKSDATGTKYIWTVDDEIYSTLSNEEYVISSGDLAEYERGNPVQVYIDGALLREFYLDNIEERRGGIFVFSCVSAVGLLAERPHLGGVYAGTTAGAVIADILSTISYTIDADVAATTVYGWLPYDSARNNLSKVLFATGASLMKTATGGLHIRYNQPTSAKDVSANTFYDMNETPVPQYGTIRIVEHTFFDSANQTETVVYDNTNSVTASNYLVVFEEPMASLRASGITINSSGANWAIVSGTGVLYGTPYVHIRRIIEQSTGINSAEVFEVENNGLISRLNSGSVIDRTVNYYANAKIHSIATKHTTERPGDIVTFPNLDGITVPGYVNSVDTVISGFTKAHMDVIGNWTPTGLGNQYTEYFLITSISGSTITIPTAHRGKRALVVLFSGAYGGSGGYDGERGHSGAPFSDSVVSRGYGGIGGDGGAPGTPGGPGKYLIGEIASLAASYTGSLGAGGAGGARNGEAGTIGGDTVMGSFTTANGSQLEGPYVNMIDGSTYGQTGAAGNAGKAGGSGGDLLVAGKKGEDGTAGVNYSGIWTGGAGGLGTRYGSVTASGGGGGGAAYGAAAQNAGTATDAVNHATAGANAAAPAQAGFYTGGAAGNGGGGGGGSAYYYNGVGGNYTRPGDGGLGSVGGQGANGFILVYV
ncbi:MAG: hypothetical protein IJG87_02280 [Ruminococcus sp.]|nr:hypothetical protein [Ruminococcus sp.]